MIERAGDATPRRVDVRVLASTSRSLDTEVREGRFRDDLLRRLRVVRIRVPPLRERRGDIVLLTEHLLARHGAARVRLTPSANGVLAAGEWPGNVRQLERVVRHLAAGVASGADALIEPQHLPETMLGGAAPAAATQHATEDRRTTLLRALSSHGGNRTAAARALGIGRATFYRWWREEGLGGPDAPVH